MRKIKWLLIVILLFGCKKNKSIILNNERVVGEIIDDTVYNGLVKFYNTVNNRLIRQSNYLNGKLNGKTIWYDENGRVYSKVYYDNGKINGYSFFYDANGNKLEERYYYYGLSCGPTVFYKNNKIHTFCFYTLENELLCLIPYDSLFHKSLPDIDKPVIPYFISDHTERLDTGKRQLHIFLYLINPPKLKFDYSLIKIDTLNNTQYNITAIENNGLFTDIEIADFGLYTVNDLAIKLVVFDSIRSEKVTMLKKLHYTP